MNWKLVVLGGLAFYLAMWIVSFATGPLIHEGVLEASYEATSEFWRPELNQDPPDMAALMPRWLAVGIVTSLITAAVYGWIRPAFSGAGWKKGLKFGLMMAVLAACWDGGWSGIFNLPDKIWVWWGIEGFVYYLFGGLVLGWLGGRLAPETHRPAAP